MAWLWFRATEGGARGDDTRSIAPASGNLRRVPGASERFADCWPRNRALSWRIRLNKCSAEASAFAPHGIQLLSLPRGYEKSTSCPENACSAEPLPGRPSPSRLTAAVQAKHSRAHARTQINGFNMSPSRQGDQTGTPDARSAARRRVNNRFWSAALERRPTNTQAKESCTDVGACSIRNRRVRTERVSARPVSRRLAPSPKQDRSSQAQFNPAQEKRRLRIARNRERQSHIVTANLRKPKKFFKILWALP